MSAHIPSIHKFKLSRLKAEKKNHFLYRRPLPGGRVKDIRLEWSGRKPPKSIFQSNGELYVLPEVLGSGGEATVKQLHFLAQQDQQGLYRLRTAASAEVVRTYSLRPDEASDTSLFRRFLKDQQILRDVYGVESSVYQHAGRHKFYDDFYDDVERDQATKLSMRFEHLGRSFIDSAGLSRLAQLDMLLKAAQQIAALHANGIVHRDVKPENLMRKANGDVQLIDFDSSVRVGEKDYVFGSLSHMPGEVRPAMGSDMRIKAHVSHDCYAFGVTIDRMFEDEMEHYETHGSDFYGIGKLSQELRSSDPTKRPDMAEVVRVLSEAVKAESKRQQVQQVEPEVPRVLGPPVEKIQDIIVRAQLAPKFLALHQQVASAKMRLSPQNPTRKKLSDLAVEILNASQNKGGDINATVTKFDQFRERYREIAFEHKHRHFWRKESTSTQTKKDAMTFLDGFAAMQEKTATRGFEPAASAGG